MGQAILVAGLAGLASALLSGVLNPGSVAFAMLIFLAPLPLFIAGLGWHAYVAALGGLLAALAINLAFGTRPSLAFIGSVGLPAFAITAYAERLFSRGSDHPGIDLGRLAIAAIIGVALIVVMSALWVEPDFAEFQKRLRAMVEQVVAAMGRGANMPPIPPQQMQNIIDIMVRLMLPLSGFFLFASLVLSGTLGLVVTDMAKRLAWPRPDFRSFRLPGGSLILFGMALIASTFSGFTGVFAEIVLLGLALMLMLQGLAVLHVKMIGNAMKVVTLTGAWLSIMVLGIPALIFIAIGMADHLLDFRRPKAGQS